MVEMNLRLWVVAHAQAQERSSRYFEAHVTIAISGAGIDILLLVNLRIFIKDRCLVGLCLIHKHIKWLWRVIPIDFQFWTRKSRWLWDGSKLLLMACCFLLEIERRHRIHFWWKLGIAWRTKEMSISSLYIRMSMSRMWMKDKREYVELGKVGFKNWVSLSYTNILQ